MHSKVQHTFDSYPAHIKPKMERLREIIFEVAETTEGVGTLEETLKWGEPAYLPSQTKSGTTVRIDWKAKKPEHIGLYVSCNTSLVDEYRTRFGDVLTFEGNRAVLLPVDQPLPQEELIICIRMALRYHIDKTFK